MNYKSIYLNSFKEKINEIETEIITEVKKSRKRNKNFTTLSNKIAKELRDQEIILRTSLINLYPEIFENFLQRYEEYESDHLSSFFTFIFPEFTERYPVTVLNKCAKELGAYEGCTHAAANFSNSTEFLKTIYVLDKNYDHYRLGFDPNDNPLNSHLFDQMRKERFPENAQEAAWEGEVLKGIVVKDSEQKIIPNEKDKKENNILTPGDLLNEDEKLFILHILKQYTELGSDIKTTEFLRILHLTSSIIDGAADLSKKLPNYRKVNDGWINFPKNQRITNLENIIAKLNRFQLPTIKSTLNQKLKTELKKK